MSLTAGPEDPQPQLQTALFTKVVQALLSGRGAGSTAEEFLDEQRRRHLTVMRELTAARRTASIHDSLLLDYQLFHIEADLRWIDHASSRLDTLAADIQL
jgi:hypothetical protein